MEPMRNLPPVIRFSEIRAWFTSRREKILKGIYKLRNDRDEIKELTEFIDLEVSKNSEIQKKQIELSSEIEKLQKSIEKQNKKLDEAIWLLKTQFEDLEEQTIDQLLEMKQMEKHQIAENKKRFIKMRKELAFSMLDQQSMVEKYFDRVVQMEQKLEIIESSQNSSLLRRLFGHSSE